MEIHSLMCGCTHCCTRGNQTGFGLRMADKRLFSGQPGAGAALAFVLSHGELGWLLLSSWLCQQAQQPALNGQGCSAWAAPWEQFGQAASAFAWEHTGGIPSLALQSLCSNFEALHDNH